jgi:hypothetical protein
MTGDRTNQGRIGTVAPGRACRLGQATVLVPLVLLGSMLIALGAAGAQQVDPPLPGPTPTARVPERPLSLNLDRVLSEPGQGHSEFNISLRREAWSDPMVRLGFALGCEEGAARRGGLVGYPVRFTAGGLQVPPPPVDLRLVLSGPFADDWQDLSPQERVVRVTETVVYYGLIFEILRELQGRVR